MERIIQISGKDVKLKASAATLYRYKMQFNRDLLQDLFNVSKVFDAETEELETMDGLEMQVFYDMTWTLAKSADPTIPEPLDWLDRFESFEIETILPDVIEMISKSLGNTIPGKKKNQMK